MLRIGTQCIVTLPNFGHWRSRLHLLTHGRMPVLEHLPHEWYDTPNIHLCTIRDFELLCHRRNVAIREKVIVGQQRKLGEMYRVGFRICWVRQPIINWGDTSHA